LFLYSSIQYNDNQYFTKKQQPNSRPSKVLSLFSLLLRQLGQESATLNLQHGTFIFNINFFQNGALGRQKGGPALARAWKHLFALIFCFFGIYIERSRNI
jgi:hypothetical protein